MSRTVICSCLLGAFITAWGTVSAGAQDGTIVVVNKGSATATLIDMPSGNHVAVLPTGEGPHETIISPEGRFAVVTNYGGQGGGGNSLTVIDIAGASVTRTIDLGTYRRPHGIVFQGSDVVAVTSEATRNVVLVRVSTGEIVRAIGTDQDGSHMVTPIVRGNRAYTSNIANGTVSELDIDAGRLVQVLNVAPQVEAITASPDGAEVWVGSNGEGTINVISTETGEVRVAARDFAWPYRILITPDNATAIIPDLRGNTVRFFDRASHSELGRIAFPGAGPQGITLSPDASTAFLSLSRQGRIAVIDLESRAVVRHIDSGPTPDGIGFSAVKARR